VQSGCNWFSYKLQLFTVYVAFSHVYFQRQKFSSNIGPGHICGQLCIRKTGAENRRQKWSRYIAPVSEASVMGINVFSAKNFFRALYVQELNVTDGRTDRRSGGSRKKYLGGRGPHHLGGNNVRLSEITIEPNYQLKIWGPGQDLGGLCPPGPSLNRHWTDGRCAVRTARRTIA